MQCSISSPKPNPSWLDRLRSSKGFPVSDGPQSLDQFLSSNLNPNPNPNPPKIPPLKPQPTKNQTLFTLMTNVLSDLFVMRSSRPTTPQKASRKQPNPRNYNGGGVREVSPSSVNNGVESEGRKRKLVKVRKMRGEDGVVMKEGLDLEGFSRTEVTVIDTSLGPEWKASRVLYRKGLVWKVGEKKVVRVGRKKRRRVGGSEEKKAAGVGREQMGVLDKKQGCAQIDDGQDSEGTDDQILIPRKPKFSKLPGVSATNTSSILHVKNFSKKNCIITQNNALKGNL